MKYRNVNPPQFEQRFSENSFYQDMLKMEHFSQCVEISQRKYNFNNLEFNLSTYIEGRGPLGVNIYI